jgi:hypothetical protein
MKTTLTFILLFLAGANGCDSGSHNTQSTSTTPQNVEPPKFAELYDSAENAEIKWSGPFVHSEGTWVSDNPVKKDGLPSVAQVGCYKNGGRFLVGDSDAYCMVATARIATVATKQLPLIDVSYYPILSWDKNRIVAADSPTAPFPYCLWSQITIDRQNHTVSVTDSRKLRKDLDGLRGACTALPLSETYHLMDSSETKTLESYLPFPRR